MKFARQVWSQVRQPNAIVARSHLQSLVYWPAVTSCISQSPLFPFCHPYCGLQALVVTCSHSQSLMITRSLTFLSFYDLWCIKIKTKTIFDKNKDKHCRRRCFEGQMIQKLPASKPAVNSRNVSEISQTMYLITPDNWVRKLYLSTLLYPLDGFFFERHSLPTVFLFFIQNNTS